MWWIVGIAAFLLAAVLFEYRVRNPDQILLYESRGQIRRRAARLYPRHLSLSVPATVQSLALEVPTEAKGRVGLVVKLAATVAADPERVEELVRVGGWDSRAVERAAEELRVAAQGLVREYTEQHEIEELSSAKLSDHLEERLRAYGERLGLEVIAVTAQSLDPSDPDIAETLRRREEARIRERTEKVDQEARVAAARARVEADTQVALAEHELELKRLALRSEQEQEQAQLERMRVEEQLDRRRLQLEVDREEVDLVAKNPHLLVLTPQVARLAEASQSLRNARTIVSLAGDEFPEGSPVLQTLLSLLRGSREEGGERSGAGSENDLEER
jgi:hypothetical protein